MKPLLDNPNELLYTDQLDRHYGDMPHRVVLMMLDNLNKPFAELKTPIEEWAYIFKNETLKSEIIPETKVIEGIEFLANKNLGIREFIERMDVNNLPRDVSNSYMRNIHSQNTTLEDLDTKGVKKGKTEGIEIGDANEFERGLLKGVRAMKKIKMTDDEIATELGLTEKEVADINVNDL